MSDSPPPRPRFLLHGEATIKHLNIRKEGPEDEQVLAVDVKMTVANVDRRFCLYFDDALEAFLWRGNTDALIARNAYMVPVAYSNTVRDAVAEISGETFRGCEVKKFSLEPRDGGVLTVSLSVSLYPDSDDVSELAKRIQDEVHVHIEGPADLFAAEAPSAGKTAEA